MSLEQDIADLRADLAAVLGELDRVTTPVERIAWRVREAAERVGVSDRTMRDLIKSGAVHAVVYPGMRDQFVPDWSLRQLVQDPTAARPSLAPVQEAS